MADDDIEQEAAARARAAKFKARVLKGRTNAEANAPSILEDIVGGGGAVARMVLRGGVGALDLPGAVTAGLTNIPANFRNASQPYGPREKTVTPQELFGDESGPAMQPTDVFDKLVPPIKGYEHTPLDFPAQVAGGMLVGGGFRGITGAPAAAPRAGAVLPTLAVPPAAAPGILPAVGRGVIATTGAAARAGVRTGVTTGAILAGEEGGGYVGRKAAEAIGGPEYGDLGEHYGRVAGSFAVPAIVDIARVPAYNVLNSAYTKPGGANVPGSSAHTLQAFDDLALPADLGTAGNAPASNLLDYTAGLPGSGGPAMRTRSDLYGGVEQAIIDAAAHRRALATGGPPMTGVGRNIDEVNIGERAIDAGTAARGRIYDANDVNYNDPVTGLHQIDPATGQPILDRDAPIAVQSEHDVYTDIMARPGVNKALARPTVTRLRDELTEASDLVVDPILETQLQNARVALEAQRAAEAAAATPDLAVIARIDAALAATQIQINRNRGPSFQAQRDARQAGRTRDNNVLLNERVADESAVAKTETMRAAADQVGLADVFRTTEEEASRLLAQREAISGLTPDANNVRPTGQAGFNALFNKGGAGDLAQLGALLEHAPAETGLTFADRMELVGRGKPSAGTQDVNPAAWNPVNIVNLWDNATPQARDVYAPPGTPLRRHIEAVVAVARADNLRTAARTKPGRGSNTLGGPQRFFTHPLLLGGIGLGAGAAGAGLPGLGLLMPFLPSIMARAVGSRFTNPNFTRNVVHPPTMRGSLDLSRLLGAAVGGNVPTRPDAGQLLKDAGTAAGRAARYPYP